MASIKLLLLAFSNSILLASAHYPYSSSSPSPASSSEWRSARATYYAAADPRDAVGGACGYGDLEKAGYGKRRRGLVRVRERGRHVVRVKAAVWTDRVDVVGGRSRWCIPGTSIIVTATNFCAPNYGFPADGGGKCNPPNAHFVLPIEIFEKIAIWKASNMPIQYRRIKCRKEGGMRFTIDGAGIFVSVLINNVAGAGDIFAVKIKGSRTGWLQMNRNWGQNWHINADLKNQPLSFEVTSSDGLSITSYNVAPKDWSFGQTFEGKQFQS
ncbi:hypothetical protein E3N88_01692 [Mikania micrantha]|uniref:Expansin n=1 Tax=Mikania micrantha TaxID=192012 RepID=A0A5N6Q399_9ASTR|nr:hypothetical protein E3N88_01692 [Mikania micrantha]